MSFAICFFASQELLNTGIFTIGYAITTLFQLVNWASVNYYGRASNIVAAVSCFFFSFTLCFLVIQIIISFFPFSFFCRFSVYSIRSHTQHQRTSCTWSTNLAQHNKCTTRTSLFNSIKNVKENNRNSLDGFFLFCFFSSFYTFTRNKKKIQKYKKEQQLLLTSKNIWM